MEPNDHTFIMLGCDYAFTEAQLDYTFMEKMMTVWNKKYPDI